MEHDAGQKLTETVRNALQKPLGDRLTALLTGQRPAEIAEAMLHLSSADVRNSSAEAEELKKSPVQIVMLHLPWIMTTLFIRPLA